MLLKKTLLSATLACLILTVTVGLQAQDVDLDAITEEQLSQESPLTTADIDLYLKFFAQSAELVKDPSADFKQATLDFIKANDITATRLRYILEKVPYGMIVATSGNSNLPTPQPHMVLSEGEITVINDNLPKIMSAVQQYAPPQQ
jgi:hypothetical protein